MEDCFLPGDIVRALVASIGDSRSYFLSTARADLGVVFARAADGTPLNRSTDVAMTNPLTTSAEARKVAQLPADIG